MKYRELLEGQSKESSLICMTLLQASNEDYQKIMEFITSRFDEEMPDNLLKMLGIEK